MAVLRSTVGPECDHPLSKEKITIRCVGFGLLTCWFNTQLPYPLLGSLCAHAQGVRHTSLTGWNNSNFSKDKNKNMLAVQMNSFSNPRLREFFKSYIRFSAVSNLSILRSVCILPTCPNSDVLRLATNPQTFQP